MYVIIFNSHYTLLLVIYMNISVQKTILVTGGLGYIGSHAVIELLNCNYQVIIIDDLSNSCRDVLDSIYQITNILPPFYQINVSDKRALNDIFATHKIDAVIHFAAFKAVGESTKQPLIYYHNNVGNTIILLEVMQTYQIKTIVFSSSATVYNENNQQPHKENSALLAKNPYGQTKLIVEQLLQDLYNSDNSWQIATLRYFNPIGAHKSHLIGEFSNDTPNNLMPYICKVAANKHPYLQIFGNDYPTVDGTGVRDYIHVVDLAIGHVKTLEYLYTQNKKNIIINLGSGKGYSVLEILREFEKVANMTINYKFYPRRNGDVAISYADISLAHKILNWQPQNNLSDMCFDSFTWQQNMEQ